MESKPNSKQQLVEYVAGTAFSYFAYGVPFHKSFKPALRSQLKNDFVGKKTPSNHYASIGFPWQVALAFVYMRKYRVGGPPG